MRKIIISMLVILLVFSELNVSVAEMSIIDPTESEIECEEQLETDSEENLPTQCEEQLEPDSEGNSATEEEKQPESESEADLTTEEEKQPEPESEADLTTEEEEQPESESEADLTTEEEKQPESESGKDLTTEGEEQEESESEENLANACESQPESESKENLAIEGEEQLEFGSEDNPEIDCEEQEEPESEENLEIECTEEFYSGEGLVTESEEPLGLDSEEKLVTEDEEQPKFNSKEKLAPNCKRPRIWSTKIRDIDFSALDDSKNELDEFTQVFTNTGLEFPSGEKNGRTYYMYFGDLNNKRPVNSLVGETYRDYDDDWSRPLPAMDQALNSIGNTYYVQAQNFSVATALAQNPTLPNGIVSYYFGNGIASKHPDGNGLVIAHASTKSNVAAFQSGAMPLLKLYKNEKTHELIGYTVVMNGMDVDGYVKIKMSPVRGTEGRINVSMKYLKKSNTYPLTTLAYSVHMDVGMRHENTKLYSLGNHEGFYFNEENMGDGDNYRITFFRDGYTNHPTAFSTTQRNPSNKPFHMYFQTLSSSNRPVYDPGKDAMYDLKPDPGWAVRWDHINQKPGDVREVNLELAVTDGSGVAPEKGPPVIQLDKDGEYTDNGYRMTGTWKDPDSEYVSLFYIISGSSYHQIGEFKNSNLNTDVPWEYTVPIKQVEKGLDHECGG
ncbi:hypothetical protein B1B04_23345 [Lysinibacillus sp. KCTC 33748]|uniref:hypothetical protein n=1 Tax=unclassified Lysinibacillus TaxID=2636778 RepID=UPI0009A705CA|nr:MULTISPECIES: hypothetical protein [unclassified Lysinibacillus]OXS66991.1 hypothetical protein B1B04_23345 [Lysinibacillus sp. KCTC 33748]SKC16236.1 hypothetical protein SAMN06295926_13139 [Lysinibacillus sp. AC-3]